MKYEKATKSGKVCMANFCLGKHNYFDGLVAGKLDIGGKWFENDLSDRIKLGELYEIDYISYMEKIIVKAVRPYVRQADFA